MARIFGGVGSIIIPPTLVIGANGFIGRAVVDALALADPTSVRAGIRSRAAGPHIAYSGPDVVSCDLNDASSLRSAMAGQSVVIHCARDAINERGREPDGIVSLIDTAKQSGINRFIYLSSVAVYGQVSGVVTESTLPTPPILPYGENKLRAEKICQAAATRDFRVVVLRPALVYGPYGEEWTVRFVRDLVGGRLTGLGPAGEGIANLVYIDDLARFCVRLTTDNIQPFTLLNVNGDDHPSFNQYFERMSSALGFGSLAKPDALYYHEARRFLRRLLRAGFKFQRRMAPPILTQTILGRLQKRMEMRYAYNHWDQCLTVRPSEVLFSNEASKQHGFVSRISLDDGLRAVEKWAREEGLIP